MPQLGESIAEATVVRILKSAGSKVKADEEIFEVETNKATMTVIAPVPGELEVIGAEVGTSYAVGARLATLKVSEQNARVLGLSQNSNSTQTLTQTNCSTTPAAKPDVIHFQVNDADTIYQKQPQVEPVVGGLPVPAGAAGASYISPRMKARMTELGLNAADLAAVAGTGAGGRVTVEDFEGFLRNLESHRMTPASPMRMAVADAMRRSCSRPLATVGSPVLLDALLAHRKKSPQKAGPALYAIRALAIAITENTAVAGRLIGNRIVHPSAIDIGFAVEVEDGVLVPTLRDVEEQTLADLIPTYNDLVEKARARKLPRENAKPGIATVTNFGTFGIDWATPIPLPEQNLVMGLGAGRKQPIWSNEVNTFVPVTMAELTLSFDHRILDGGGAGRLLGRVAALLQEPHKL
jgi:pyruvate/2-oxoglutarate dehydrogenase complex dihydrolipoamide acyltransferase (E2) component